MRARSVLDLREVGLADALAFSYLRAKCADQFELGQGSAETAQRTFDFAQVSNFLAQLHPAPKPYFKSRYLYCNLRFMSRGGFPTLSTTWDTRTRASSAMTADRQPQAGAGTLDRQWEKPPPAMHRARSFAPVPNARNVPG